MRLDSENAREYYLNETREQGWSVRELERNIRSGYFKRLLSSQKPTPLAEERTKTITNEDLIKDPYVLEFLGSWVFLSLRRFVRTKHRKAQKLLWAVQALHIRVIDKTAAPSRLTSYG